MKSTDPLGYVTSYDYDAAGRVIKTVSPSGVYQTTTYDLAGRASAGATFTSAGLSTLSSTATYDQVNNLLTSTNSIGTTTSYAYDASNTLLSVTQPIAVGVNAVTSYGYDANGNNTRVTDGNSNSWQTVYNSWGLVESRIEPATSAYPNAADRTFTTRYDGGGLPVLEMQPGVNITRAFDNLGRLTAESTLDGANRGYVYDLANRPTTVTSGATSISLGYNERSQLVSASGSAGVSSFRYDPAGRPTQRVDAAGTTSYSWRQNGQLSQIGDPVTGQTSTFNWAAPATAHAGQLTSVTTTNTTRTYGYDGIGRVASDVTTAGATTLWSAGYQYNSAGRVDSKTIGPVGVAGAGVNSYSYSLAGQLTGWTDPAAATTAYSYDLAGNRTSNGATSIVFDARNRIVTEGTKTYAWSARGTLDSITDGANTTNYSFDGLGRMTAADGVGYSYDGFNRIINRDSTAFTYSGTHNQPTSDGVTILSRTPDGSPHAIAEGATRLSLLADRHGDITASITTAGVLVDSVAYSPWGEPAARQGATALTVGFQSSYTDPTTGLIDMGARWYQPSTGTFTNRDTYNGILSTPISLNRYTYANNNPIDYFDPNGLMSADAAEKYASKGYSCTSKKYGPDCEQPKAKPKPTKTADRAQREHDHAVAEATAIERLEMHGGPTIFTTVDPTDDLAGPNSPPAFMPDQAADSPGYSKAKWTYSSGEMDKQPELGVIRFNLFIPSDKVCVPLCFDGWTYYGDDRSFDTSSTAFESRLAAEYDFVNGTYQIFANYTCKADGECGDALPIWGQVPIRGKDGGRSYRPTENSPRSRDDDSQNVLQLLNESIQFHETGNFETELSWTYSIMNPIQPFGARVGADGILVMDMSKSGELFYGSAQCTCDGFPSIEVYQYKDGSINTLFKQEASNPVIELPG